MSNKIDVSVQQKTLLSFLSLKRDELQGLSLFEIYKGPDERGYKFDAHQKWVSVFKFSTEEELNTLINRDLSKLLKRAKQTLNSVNLLSMYEKSALSEVLMHESTAKAFLYEVGMVVLAGFSNKALNRYFNWLPNLNFKTYKGKTAPEKKWTIATLFLFLTDPKVFPFIKPSKIRNCFALFSIPKETYIPTPNWDTYCIAKELYDSLFVMLNTSSLPEDQRAEDFIDVQTVVFMLGGGYYGWSTADSESHLSWQDFFLHNGTVWDWIEDSWRDCKVLKSPGGTTEYSDIRLSNTADAEITYGRSGSNQDLKRHRIEKHTKILLKDGYLKTSSGSKSAKNNTNIDYSELTITMWALGWQDPSGLVYNESDSNDTTFYLRYIPVDFNLFDSIMAELNLRRRQNNPGDDTVAIYEPTDWLKEDSTGAWSVHVKKDATTGYSISIENNGKTTPIDLTDDKTVKQFAEYDWSTSNANTLDGETEPRFYVSWPEKMLLQEFLRGELENSRISKPPQIIWCINTTDPQSTHETPLIGIHFNILNTDWNQVNIMAPNYDNIATIRSSDVNQIYPFLVLIRDGDKCIRTPKHNGASGTFSQNDNSVPHDQFSGLIRKIDQWQPLTISKSNHKNKQTVTLNQQAFLIHYPNSTVRILKQQDLGLVFTEGFDSQSSDILYKDFIEQRAKVLDPTSRALLVYLKYNTPINQTTYTPEDENSEESPVTTPAPRTPDKLSKNKLIQKLTISKNLILEGVPGTGKTYAFKQDLVENWHTELERKCQDEAITMHPSTSYEDFLEGLRPAKIEKPSYADNLNIPLANNRFIVRETSEIIYVDDRTENKKRMATVPKSLLDGFLQHANQQGWNHEYNQGDAKKSFRDHTTWNVWPLTDGATFHGVAKYYIEHGLTINDSLGQSTTQNSSSCTISICNKQDTESFHWFFQAPTTTKGNFTVADGFFLNVCKQAVQNPSKDYLVLLDEINRCNIPSVFGDLLTAIERSKRATWNNDNQCWNLDDAQIITLAISKRKFFVPENVYVVGTMNTTDRSVAPMDMALRRRFAFHRIEPVAPIQENFPLDEGKFPNRETYWALLQQSIEAVTTLNTELAKWGKDALLGYSYIYDLAADLERYGDHQSQLIEHHWNHHILPQLADILFSNQINDTAMNTVLASITTETHGFTIQNTSTNTNNSFERPTLSVGE